MNVLPSTKSTAFMTNVRIILSNLFIEIHLNCLQCHIGKRRFNVKLWKTFTDCFNCLPVAAVIDEKIFCVYVTVIFLTLFYVLRHGGLSPEHNHMDQIRCDAFFIDSFDF